MRVIVMMVDLLQCTRAWPLSLPFHHLPLLSTTSPSSRRKGREGSLPRMNTSCRHWIRSNVRWRVDTTTGSYYRSSNSTWIQNECYPVPMNGTASRSILISLLLLLLLEEGRAETRPLVLGDEWGRSAMSQACESLESCVLATARNPHALDALASFLGTNVRAVEHLSHIQLLEENLRLRLQLFGSCQEESGEFLSFVDPDTETVGAAVCRFDSVASELRARTSRSMGLDKRISAAHPCFEEDRQIGTVILLAILFFFVSATVLNVGQIVRVSAETARSTKKNVALAYMASSGMT